MAAYFAVAGLLGDVAAVAIKTTFVKPVAIGKDRALPFMVARLARNTSHVLWLGVRVAKTGSGWAAGDLDNGDL
jgi:hypothetical protein